MNTLNEQVELIINGNASLVEMVIKMCTWTRSSSAPSGKPSRRLRRTNAGVVPVANLSSGGPTAEVAVVEFTE